MLERVKEAAAEDGVSTNYYVRRALVAALRRKTRREG
jgi:predicted HicB family RNase H-like nuclease